MNTLLLAVAAVGNLHSLLVTFLILLIVIAIIGGLIWAIERFVAPIPGTVKMVIALVLVLLLLIWAVTQFVPGL